MNILTTEEINKQQNSLRLSDLKKFINDNPGINDDTVVLIERIEDTYFEGIDISGMGGCTYTENGVYPEGSKTKGWGVYTVEGFMYHNNLKHNANMFEEISRRERDEEPQYSMDDPRDYIYPEDLVESSKEQFYTANCITKNNKFILIYSHY